MSQKGERQDGQQVTCVKPYPHMELPVRDVFDLEAEHVGQYPQGDAGDLTGMQITIADREAADHHVGVAYRLDLVRVVLVHHIVEHGVEIVEHVHHLNQRGVVKIEVLI